MWFQTRLLKPTDLDAAGVKPPARRRTKASGMPTSMPGCSIGSSLK